MVAAVFAAATPLSAQQSTPATPSPAELSRRIAAAADSLGLDRFSGVVVIARDGVPVVAVARGLADRERSIPIDTGTAFNLGSINKAFTQVAIAQLAAAGKLELDSPLARAWPDYPNRDVARRVTVRQIVQMRSGIQGDIFAAPASGNRHDLRRLADFLPLFVHEPLAFEPGTQRQYSNAGYVVLGLLVERLSGESYYDYVREHIYGPAGMTRTAHFAIDSLPAHTAVGYTHGPDPDHPGPLAPNADLMPGRGSSAGGGYATAGDLLKYLAARRSHRLADFLPAGLGIAGGAPGINATLDAALPGGYDMVVMTNLDPPAAMEMARLIRGWLGARD